MAALRLHLRRSTLLASLLGGLHLLALFSAAVSLEAWPLALAGVGVCLSAVGSVGDALRLWPGSVLDLELGEGGRVAWRDRRGAWHEGKFAGHPYVSRWLIAAVLVGPGVRRTPLALAPDAAAPEDMRKLRLWLRWKPLQPEEHGAPQ